ncbi:MAG TPA: transglutaminase domain-containing protein [Anaerolineales bacterium]|nr:transglutaminase domain-containing protein [Anaerolineales bacterium]
MMARILRAIVSAEAMGLLLVIAALQALTYGIGSSLRNTDTRYFFLVCVLGALIAFGLSKRNGDGILASFWMIVLGVSGIWILGARLVSPLLDLGEAILTVLPQVLSAIRSETPIDTSAIADAWTVVAEASHALGSRFQTWLIGLRGNIIVNDALIRNMVWLLIMWLISAWMGWFAGRRNAIAALTPSLLLLSAVTSYSEHKVNTLWVMVFVLLLLMGVWNYRNHTAQWEQRKVDYSDSIRYDVTQAVILLSLVVGGIAFIMPSISWQEIRDYLRERNNNQIADTLGVQQQQVPAQPVPGPKPSLPRDHLLSGGYAQSEKVVMTIRTGELPPVANPVFAEDAPRYYWRSTTYDTYMGAGWVTSSGRPQNYSANTPLIPGLLNGYRTLHLAVEMAEPEGKLFWSGILFSADVPLRADWRLRPESTLFADQSALLEADLFAAASKARAYRAESYVPLVTVEEMRATSTDYPASIRERYLRLPKSVPERVHQLAREITQGKVTAYDKAKAIEAFLRSYPYDLEVPIPPEEQDVADYFLFDLKKGYCDYYATAMVVLARSSGLPARFVSGYASGSYDAASAVYIVRELHAHSWAEVYFPEIGWIEFEPTAGQPEIERPPTKQEILNAEPDPTASRLLNQFRLETLLYWLSPFGILLLGLLLYFTLIERWLYLRLAPAVAVERIYRRLYRVGRPLAGERAQAETAFEFMQKLVDKINTIRERSRFSTYLISVQQDVQFLTGMYQDTLFADHTMNKDDTRTALNTWKHLRVRLHLARWNNALHYVILGASARPRQSE